MATTSPLVSWFNRVGTKDRVTVIRQLAIILDSGLPLTRALALLAGQAENATLRTALKTITADVENGYALSAAMARFPMIFNEVVVATIKSGESSGKLDTVLGALASQLEAEYDFSGRVRSTFYYPAFVLTVMIVVIIILTTFVIPKLNDIFTSSAMVIPWTTQVLIWMGNLLVHFWYLFILFIVAAVLGLRSYLGTTEGQHVVTAAELRIPVVRDLVQGMYLTRVSRLMGMMVVAGVPIVDALRIVSTAIDNSAFRSAITTIANEVERGVGISTAMARHSFFPKSYVEMIDVGEKTGKLHEVLDKMTAYWQEDTDTRVRNITALLEPSIIMVVALGVGFVAIAVIMPIYSYAQQI